MNLEDLLVMEVPIKQLRYICTSNNIKPGGSSAEAYAHCISSNEKLHPEAQFLIDEYRFAGKTTVRLYKPLGNKLEKFNNINYFMNFLREKYGDQLFTSGIRPETEEIPKLFKAVQYNGKYFLSYIYLGQEHRVYRNYEIIKERPQNVDYLVIHFNPLLLQVRVPKTKDQLFKQAFLNTININEDIEWSNITALSDSEIHILRERLRSTLICAKHKMTEGPFDTIEVRAKPGINLAEEPKYKDEYEDKPCKSMKIEFPFQYSNGLKEVITIQVTQEGINFYNEVSEEIIQHVVNCIFSINNTNVLVASATE